MILIIGTELQARDLNIAPGIECIIEGEDTAGVMLRTIALRVDCIAVYMNSKIKCDIIPEKVKKKLFRFDTDEELKRKLGGEEEATNNFDESALESNDSNLENVNVSNEDVNNNVSMDDMHGFDVEDKVEASEYDISYDIEGYDENEVVIGGTEDNGVSTLNDITSLDDVMSASIAEADTELPEEFSFMDMVDGADMAEKQLEAKDQIIAQLNDKVEEISNSRDALLERHKDAIKNIKEANDRKSNEYERIIEGYKREVDKANTMLNSSVVKKALVYSTNPKAIIKEGYKDTKFPKNVYALACNTHDDLSFLARHLEEFIRKGCLIMDFTSDYIIPSLISTRVGDKMNRVKNTLKVLRGGTIEDNVVRLNDVSELIASDIYHDVALLNVDWTSIVAKAVKYAGGRDILMIFGSIKGFNVANTVSVLSSFTNASIITRSSPINIQTLFGSLRLMPCTKDQSVKIIAVECVENAKALLNKIGDSRKVYMFGKVSSELMYDTIKKDNE